MIPVNIGGLICSIVVAQRSDKEFIELAQEEDTENQDKDDERRPTKKSRKT